MNAGVVVNGGAMLSNNDNEEGERKKEQQQQLPYLDENICTEILIRVPVESLFNSFRYVCKSWLNIITNHPSNFPLKRLRSKPPCLIIQQVKYLRNSHEELQEEEEEEEEEEEDYTCTTSFIKMGKQGIEKQFDVTPIFQKLRIRACCNGLILVSCPESKRISTLYVVNPLTNHQVMLPPHPLESDPQYARYRPGTVKFVFIPSTGEYRVVMGGFYLGNEILQPKRYIQILTLSAEDCCGSSSSSPNDDCDLPRREWRIIEVPERQFMHQVGPFFWIWGRKNITFDVDTEKFYEFTYPVYHGHQVRVFGLMKMGGFLTYWVLGFLHRYDDAVTLSVHVLKDFHTGEWIHQYSVRIDPDFLKPDFWKHGIGHHHPVLSSGSDEVIIFQNDTHKTLWAYNVESHQRWEVGTNLKEWDDIGFYDFHVNKNVTLESLYSN